MAEIFAERQSVFGTFAQVLKIGNMKFLEKIILFCLPAMVIFGLSSCYEEDDFTTDSSDKLEFSTDTLRFDTVFTKVGSATRIMKIYNRNARPIRISKINFKGNKGAFFRMNVDGVPGRQFENVEINAKDSIYLFAEVTIDPDLPVSASPFVIEEELLFETNGNQQTVKVEAWGQNANYFPSRFGKGGIWSVCTAAEITWNDPKPYVIYGILVVDDCLLNIPAGTQIYVHGGVTKNVANEIYNDGYIIVLKDGRLNIQGTQEQPVTIQGDRLEEEFKNRPGQWSGIIIDDQSQGNRIEFATVKNSILGIAVDSLASLTLKNVQIYNTTSVGLAGVHSQITGENCLIHSNGSNSLFLSYGGVYRFSFSTFASYGVDAAALTMSNGICVDPPACFRLRGNTLNATFNNCIIFGSRADEITIGDYTGVNNAELIYKFKNCIVRTKDLNNPLYGNFADFYDHCNPCINANGQSVLFKDPDKDDYHLDSLSIAEKMAFPISTILKDLDGNVRDAQMPDIGCFEFVPR